MIARVPSLLAALSLSFALGGCEGCAPEDGGGPGGPGAHGLATGEGEGDDGTPAGAAGVGSCDGVTPASDENHDCDGWCITVEGGWQPCDDGTRTVAGEGEGATGEGEGAVGEGEGAVGEGEGAVGEGEGEGGGPPPPPVCAQETLTIGDSTVNPRVLLVVDKSGSMAGDANGFAGSKWSAAVNAIEGVVNNLSSSMDFGLMMFPSDPDNDACSAGSLNVPVHGNAAFSIDFSLNVAAPGGATPTADTLDAARVVLNLLPAHGGPKAVVLATDGGPNCNGSLDGDTCRCASSQSDCQASSLNCLDEDNTVAAAAALNAQGYQVFVVGVPGSENFGDVLNAMATAGGTAQPGGTAYYDATSSAGLSNALEDIAVRITSCTLSLGQSASADELTVTVNGGAVAQDAFHVNGWDMTDASTVQLYGDACTAVQNGGAGVVAVERCAP